MHTPVDDYDEADPMDLYASFFEHGPQEYGVLYCSMSERLGISLVDVGTVMAELLSDGYMTRNRDLSGRLICHWAPTQDRNTATVSPTRISG